MNKQEVIEEIKKQSMQAYDDFAIIRDTAIYIVNQLDEPEKPIVPQFVADWYEENKDDFEWNVYELCVEFYERELEGKIKKWFGNLDNKPIETLVLMHKFGYEIEKLYTVELPNSNNLGYLMLQKDRRGKISVAWYCTDSWQEDERVRLTEAEIKKDFDWAWQFAEPVEDFE